MCEEAEGIVLQEAGEKVIVTSVESVVEKGCESFTVSKLEKRGKVCSPIFQWQFPHNAQT